MFKHVWHIITIPEPKVHYVEILFQCVRIGTNTFIEGNMMLKI